MTTPSVTTRLSKLINTIKNNFNAYSYVEGPYFSWSASTQSITHPQLKRINDVALLLHEIAHAELKHASYTYDIQLVQHEVTAWEHARSVLAPQYGVTIEANLIEDALDTYRLWLHHRSLCPNCNQTGIQQNKNTYSCLNCRCLWQVNEARLCRVRRQTLKQ